MTTRRQFNRLNFNFTLSIVQLSASLIHQHHMHNVCRAVWVFRPPKCSRRGNKWAKRIKKFSIFSWTRCCVNCPSVEFNWSNFVICDIVWCWISSFVCLLMRALWALMFLDLWSKNYSFYKWKDKIRPLG